jgi:SAM-dependent methyltransferase
VADIDSRYTAVLRENNIGFIQVDLTKECPAVPAPYDVIVMAEVIEHVPRPPYLVLRDLFNWLRPGGWLVLTTPNLYRLRNLVRMASGRRVFDYFLVPQPERPLGHFLEYSLDQISWHFREAGFEVSKAQLVQLDYGGSTAPRRLARRVLKPILRLYPLWRDSIVIVARRPISLECC